MAKPELFDCWIVTGDLDHSGMRYIKNEHYVKTKCLDGVDLKTAQAWWDREVYQHGINASVFITMHEES